MMKFIALALLMLFASPASTQGVPYPYGGRVVAAAGGGPFTFVASASGLSDGSSTTVATSSTLNVATGDLLIALVTWEDGASTVSTLNDGGSNTLQIDAADDFNDQFTFVLGQAAYRLAGVSNASATFTATLGAARAYKRIIVMQYRRSPGTITKDISGAREADGNSSSIVTGSFSTTGTDGVVCAMTVIYTSSTHSSTTIASVAPDQTKQESGAFTWCRIVSAGLTTQTAATTYGASSYWAASVIAFKAE